MLHKGASTQCHNQQVLAKPHHTPSDRDQQVREKLQQKVKIKSQAYIQLGEEALQTVHRTFQPDIPVILHLPALADGSLDTNSTSNVRGRKNLQDDKRICTGYTGSFITYKSPE